ncbi:MULTISPECIES: class III extradiol ring-cleavage dioxygenase [unclassified Microbulbifer]|uniref:DODA-type extradiol aromatic ring-opening family dioxygenase n=1 Tax=unclassified Microbulbifer TaxID=2619833 RepID=UPI0027E436F7|nr:MULTISPECIES: class III extradiol ring-cleavage dioxygenase [unclassified Microbulbifer]
MTRQPVFYLTHGGGPCFWMEFPEPFGAHAYDRFRDYFSGLIASLSARPEAVLVVSAHWEERIPTVSLSAAPPMIYDYYGFPPHTYQLEYPAPGAPEVAGRALELLQSAGIAAGADEHRGFDHGVFVPMMIIDPEARLPVATLSLKDNLDPAQHLAIGSALAPLRDEGVLILGSGSSYHNLRDIFRGDGWASIEFDAWLHETVALPPADRDAHLCDWTSAPGARASHPRPDHLLPLMVAAGAAGDDRGWGTFRDMIGGKNYSCFAFGSL